MSDHPQTASDYTPDDLQLVTSGCLEVATRLGGLLDDMVIVGGVVPALLIDLSRDPSSERSRSHPLDRHVGTRDLDLGFAIGLLEEERYSELSTELSHCGFTPDENEQGNLTTHRWRHTSATDLTVDFLISPTAEEEKGGDVKNLEADFSAIIVPGLELAFEDSHSVELSGTRLDGAEATQEIPVCGPGAFVLLKALACDRRGRDKDKYDLFYMIRNYGNGPSEVAEHFRPLLEKESPEAEEAHDILQALFGDPRSIGPVAVSAFVYGQRNDNLEADVAAFVGAFLSSLED